MKVYVKFFGPVYEVTGVREEKIDLEEASSISALIKKLDEKYSGLHDYFFNNEGELRDYLTISINDVFISSLDKFETILEDGDRVFLMPPIGGG